MEYKQQRERFGLDVGQFMAIASEIFNNYDSYAAMATEEAASAVSRKLENALESVEYYDVYDITEMMLDELKRLTTRADDNDDDAESNDE